jgi:hypothetical protein
MEVYLLDTHLRVNPPDPVEVVVSVHGTRLRAAIEWPAIARFLHADHADEATVRASIHRNRHEIDRAAKAHLIAYDVPLAEVLVMSPHEFPLAGALMQNGPVSGYDSGARA